MIKMYVIPVVAFLSIAIGFVVIFEFILLQARNYLRNEREEYED